MSRIPQSSRTPSKPAGASKIGATPTKSRIATSSTPARIRTQSTARSATPSKPTTWKEEPEPPPALSLKEAIALRRAEAKKAQAKGSSGALDSFASLEDTLPDAPQPEEEDVLGRLPVRDTIERARTTGSLNLATRSLQCLPSALFEMHLNITPEKLRSVPDEPVLPELEASAARRGGNQTKATWFEAQDLTILKVWNNDIQEIQHEISLFGSLKTVDLHQNKLASLPASFADLAALTVLDLSHNQLTSLPDNLFALPELTTLNLSHNQLTKLPFNAPFADSKRTRTTQPRGGDFFGPTITRATSPLPCLVNLDISYNLLCADNIDDKLPVSVTKVDLSRNPLGLSQRLLRNLAGLKRLRELKFEHAEIGDDSFPPSLFPSTPFPSLQLLDLSETQVNLGSVKQALHEMKQELNFDFSTDSLPAGLTRVLVGKRVMKEGWEIEAERRAKSRVQETDEFTDDWTDTLPPARSTSRIIRPSAVSPTPSTVEKKSPAKPKEVQKEAWEIQAEQGLLTEGAKRRARAAAAAAAQLDLGIGAPSKSSTPPPTSPSTSSLGLSNPQYYTQKTETLRLPASAPPTKAHSRAFSLAAPSFASGTSARGEDLAVPTPSLPLSTIVAQPFADNLKVLILSNRRADKSFSLPSISATSISGFLPCLEVLDLEGCNLNDFVPVSRQFESTSGASTPPRSSEMIMPTIAKLFPSLLTLNLSYNNLSNASLTTAALATLILVSPHRRGLKHLRLQGNKISELDGFLQLAESFKGNRELPGWKMEELDLRDNEVGKLPPELGLLPLDVFLVDGNTFRVPQRRVWEREGTKGLLSWLRGRIE